jgi:hypothetical protein
MSFAFKCFVALVFCLLPASASAGGQDPNSGTGTAARPSGIEASGAADATACEVELPESDDVAATWRLRAYGWLDCLTGITDRALNPAPGSRQNVRASDEVTISRGDLERVRMLAVWAKDAAARIKP